jgi:ATP-binding cassette, subfamily F, member 3
MDTKAASLSGGEKARLLLGLATMNGPNLLILDEPTNHLDMGARQSLIEALNDYNGAVILISHDRRLIEATADRLWLVSNGGVKAYDGDLDDYRALVLSGDTDGKKTQSSSGNTGGSKADQRRDAAARRLVMAPVKKKIQDAEAMVAKLQKDLGAIEDILADTGFHERDPNEALRAGQRGNKLKADLAKAEERWMALTEEYDAGVAG